MIRHLNGEGPPAERSEVGGKAASIDRIARAGLSVPPAFCLTAAAQPADGAAKQLSPGVRGALVEGLDALNDYCAPGKLFAVRSSARAEDSADRSFAGQHDTVLGVRADEVPDAVLRCWGSLRSRRSESYRARVGAPDGEERMGVIVQALVPAEVSAVVFTANPLNGDAAELVVNASFGLGAPIVSGEVDSDTLLLERGSLAVKRLDIGEKRQRLMLAPGNGIVATTSKPDSRAALSPFRTVALARLALSAEEVFGVAVDVEAACVGRRWWLLQARPVTSLPDPDPADEEVAGEKLVEAVP